MVDSFPKWPEVVQLDFCMNFLLDLVFLICITSDNETQFMAKVFKDFCKAFSVLHITTTPYHLRSNRQTERLVDTFKQASKTSDRNKSDYSILQSLRVYHVTPNPGTNSGLSLAKIMFTRTRSVFDKLLQ